ncbi:MAG: type IV secretion system protein B4 [Pseudomonadota bacterium]
MALDVNNVAANIVAQAGNMRHGFMHVPYVSLVDDVTVRLADDGLMSCIRVDGLDAMTTRDEELDLLKKSFASVLAQMGSDFIIYTHKISRKIDFLDELDVFKDRGFSYEVNERWSAGLKQRELRDTRLTISVVKTSRLKRGFLSAFSGASRLLEGKDTQRDLEILAEVVRFVRSALGTERTRVLKASEGGLLGFLGSVQTGNEQPIYPSRSVTVLSDEVLSERVTFDDEGFELTDGPDGDRFGVIRALKSYPPVSWVTIFDDFALPCDYVISQSFAPMPSVRAGESIRRKRRVMKATDDARKSAEEVMKRLEEAVLVNDVALGEHHFTISLLHPDRALLREMVSELEGVGSNVGARLVKDAVVKRAHYFAQFPGNMAARSRKNIISNMDFASYASLHRTALGKGRSELPWSTPIAVFPTSTGGPYRFSFHREGTSVSEPPAGHTLIMGETGSGKSLLASLLMTQAQRTGARVFCFDYRGGLEMTIRAMGGRYSVVESGRPTGLNPLWVETDQSGIDWVTNWLEQILSPNDQLTALQSAAITDNIRANADADPRLRNWDDFAGLFASTDDKGELEQKVKEWTQYGRFGWVFGHNTEDTFSLDGNVVGFDLTQILDAQSDRERMAVLTYIFRRIERQIVDKQRTIVLIDEAWKAIDNPYFASVIEGWLATLRKANAVVVMLTQNPGQLEKSRVGNRVFSFFPTQILFPDGKSAREDYASLRLNDAELEIVTNRALGREFLLRDDQGSVVLNGDASCLGDFLHILGGGTAGLSVVGTDYRDKPDFWREAMK